MKVLVVPDVHGSHEWESVKDIPTDSYDYIVFMGDYFDSWENQWPDQGNNFKSICTFVRDDKTHRKLLLGNHDWSYLSKTENGSRVSGHQIDKIEEIRNLLTENHDILDIAFECDDIVFSHAGFSRTWIQSVCKVLWDAEKHWSIDYLNDEWHKLSFNSHDETFNYAFEELLDWYGFFSSSGNEITQGPLWIRPEALIKDAAYPVQVVGHTEFCLGDFIVLCDKDLTYNQKNTVIATDSKYHQIFGTIDTKQLPSDGISLLDFSKYYKKTMKYINDIKSQQFNHMDYEKEFVMEKLKAAYGDKLAERYYSTFFEE